jgi:hypothetical protein
MQRIVRRVGLREGLRAIAEEQAAALGHSTGLDEYVSAQIFAMMCEIGKLRREDEYLVQYSLDGSFAIFGACR